MHDTRHPKNENSALEHAGPLPMDGSFVPSGDPSDRDRDACDPAQGGRGSKRKTSIPTPEGCGSSLRSLGLSYSRAFSAEAMLLLHGHGPLALKPFRNLAETRTPDGSRFSLHEHDGDYFLKLNGKQLMSTTATVSEIMLADLPCRQFGLRPVKVLIGGLGLGFSLKRVLELTAPTAIVEVAELLPEVVEWNREFLKDVNGKLLDDKRVRVLTKDVYEVIRLAPKPSYDAILLDVDNGPTSFVQKENKRLYQRRGFDLIARSLNPGGKVAFWSASPEPGFIEALSRVGFKTKAVPAKAHESSKRAAHVIYVAEIEEGRAEAEQEKIDEKERARKKNEALSFFRRRSHR